MAKPKAIVLCSGGLNSAVMAAVAQQENTLAMLHVRFGHRAADRESQFFDRQVDQLDPAQHLAIDMPHFATIGGNARVSKKYALEDARAISDGKSNGYVPGMVGSLLSAAFSWASVIGAQRILIGLSEDLGPPGPRTSTIYPDYSREVVELCNQAFAMASVAKPISIEAPMIDLQRSDIIKLGRRANAPFEYTWSCLSNGEEPCGACIGCATRARGFVDAGIPDPLLVKEAIGVR